MNIKGRKEMSGEDVVDGVKCGRAVKDPIVLMR